MKPASPIPGYTVVCTTPSGQKWLLLPDADASARNLQSQFAIIYDVPEQHAYDPIPLQVAMKWVEWIEV